MLKADTEKRRDRKKKVLGPSLIPFETPEANQMLADHENPHYNKFQQIQGHEKESITFNH